MQIDFKGRLWSYEMGDITNRQAVAISDHLGVTISRWAEGLDEGEDNPDYLQYVDAVYWLMLAQNGDAVWSGGKWSVTISDVEYPIARFTKAFVAALTEDAAKVPAPDPTRPPEDSEQSPEPPSPTTKNGSRDG